MLKDYQEKLNQHLTDEQRDSLAEQYKAKDKEVKGRCATDKQAWYDLKASEAEKAAGEMTRRHYTGL